MELDFTDRRRRRSLAKAHALISDAYRILCDEVGAGNPADNQFLREAVICSQAALIWVGDRWGTDAREPSGEEIEIKSTRLELGKGVKFPTSRYVSKTVIDRFRDADWWLFGVFDRYENLVALYRVEGAGMKPIIDELALRMRRRKRQGQALENNPKITLNMIRGSATVLHLDKGYREREDPQRGWLVEPVR